ncbi:hypothetical protein K435DRAFT_859765 [Dendrothele bispora CBS 962.96]|uniref:Uncharacterized protein n=1 Tax=Dendrothele bispora (strain CBS 962.96) TaxID=1314807 RepID=A0A4V4HFJ7_DENBC|nr:hypothetical protein K435DRAFT_859765 [Dendrothele bispora CBS 962.96]
MNPLAPEMSNITSPSVNPVKCAFTISNISGSIYIEAFAGPSLNQFLQDNVFVLKNTVCIMMEVIDCSEIVELLHMWSTSMEPHSWVQITKGMYAGDAALVLKRETSTATCRLLLLSVPRWKLSKAGVKKHTVRKGGPGISLSEVLQLCLLGLASYGDNPNVPVPPNFPVTLPHEDIQDMPNREYQQGLLVHALDYSLVSLVDVNMANDICQVQSAYKHDIWVSYTNLRKIFKNSNSIWVIAGQSSGREGFIVRIEDRDDMIVIEMRKKAVGEAMISKPLKLLVQVNECYVSILWDTAAVPWLDRHITVFKGWHAGQTSIMLDVHPPSSNHTELEIYSPSSHQISHIRHNWVIDTASRRFLVETFPLTFTQQHYQQPDWAPLNQALTHNSLVNPSPFAWHGPPPLHG